MKAQFFTLVFSLLAVQSFSQLSDCFDECFYNPDAACFFLYDPVCGCDGEEYSNSCFALNAGISRYALGICGSSCSNEVDILPQFEGSFGTDDEPQSYAADEYCFDIAQLTDFSGNITYNWNFGDGQSSDQPNPCHSFTTVQDGVQLNQSYHISVHVTDGNCTYADNFLLYCGQNGGSSDCTDLAGIDFGLCEAIIGIGLLNGECNYLSGCSTTGSDGVDYSSFFFESFETCETQCAVQCIDESQIDQGVLCSSIYEPVCGCDGVTYSNSCVAENYHGVTSWTEGECVEEQGCLDLEGLDFGLCDLALGVAFINNSCVSLSGCSTTASDGIDYADFIYSSYEECEEGCACIDESIIDLEAICPTVVIPVCGCDGVTYNNACEAENYYGVTSYTEGPCAIQTEPCEDLGGIDFGDCEAELGIALVNGLCSYVSGCSTTGSDGIDYSGSFMSDLESCVMECSQSDCFNPAQVNSNLGCDDDYTPVCGCDDETYSNYCYAINAGVTNWTEGECISDNVLEQDALSFTIFPVPFEEELRVALNKNIKGYLSITDNLGRQVMSLKITNESSLTIQTRELDRGIYFLSIMDDGSKNVVNQKILKK